jgi:hypothetical protein
LKYLLGKHPECSIFARFFAVSSELDVRKNERLSDASQIHPFCLEAVTRLARQ